MKDRYIDPVAEFKGLLLEIEKPARYSGGEFGILAKRNSSTVLSALIAFPDLYEIGMGNQALRIIYNRMNNIPGILCDRAFAPAPDFEKLLREKKIPLYGLDTGISLACLDLLMFTVGYELGLNGILTMLDVSEIPLRCSDRNGEHPIVIAGGPAVSNPIPFSPFIDAFWIGEAEAGFFDLAQELEKMKERGQGRAELLEKISAHPNIWVKGKEKAKRAVTASFPSDECAAAVFPVPSMKIVQNHGTVEIMRGCPNGCRFCHAGFWYRPMRQKPPSEIFAQAREMVEKGGWREISLSSLSSGDYSGVGELVENLNNLFKNRHISFQMPSLKVSGFSLELLEKISVTRKSGLTFAVETPLDAWQMAINKEVTRNFVTEIIEEAKKRGWRTAKFYFMIGLPVPGEGIIEEQEIVNFVAEVGRRTRMRFNINVGIFIPKPHTPYQWASQLDTATASEKLDFIRHKLKPLGHRVGVSDPLISQIEGLMSRGDERAGLICEEVYHGGSRLDAWSEYINKDKWRQVLEENRELVEAFLSARKILPWQIIDSGVTPEYLECELEKSNHTALTVSCAEKCSACGACDKDVKITPPSANLSVSCAKNSGNARIPDSYVNHNNIQVNNNDTQKKDPVTYRVLFSFSKNGNAVFHGHLSIIEIFSMAFTRAALPVSYTQGFNPLAKIEIASPLSTGISADGEIASADFNAPIDIDRFITSLNKSLPQGIKIENARIYHIPCGVKKHSLASLLWGFSYAGNETVDCVKANEEKVYRKNRLEKEGCPDSKSALFSLRRTAVLAQDKTGANEWASYFDTYRFLYPD